MRFIDRAFPRLHAEIIRDLWGPMEDGGGDPPNPDGVIDRLFDNMERPPRVDWVARLLRCGANPNRPGYRGMRPLHLAAGRPSEEMVELLLTHRANPTSMDTRSRCPLVYAVRPRNAMTPEREIEACGVIDLLTAVGADPNGENRYRWTPMHHAVGANSARMVNALVRARAKLGCERDGVRPIHVAALGECAMAARALLGHGADPDSKDEDGNTALHLAAHGGSLEMIRLLLDGGADPTRLNNGKRSVLSCSWGEGAEIIREAAGKWEAAKAKRKAGVK